MPLLYPCPYFYQQTICEEQQLFIAILHQKIKNPNLIQTVIFSAASHCSVHFFLAQLELITLQDKQWIKLKN